MLISVRLKLRTGHFRVYTAWIVFDCFITFVVNFHYMWGLYYICGQLIFEPTLPIFVFIKKSTLNFFLLIGSNQIKFMTYKLGQRKEFPPLLILLHQLLQPISKSRKSYLKDTTDFINYKRWTIEHFMFQWTSQVLANTPQNEGSGYTLPAGNA